MRRNIDGVSIVPTLLGKKQDSERFMYWESFGDGFHQAVRKGKWKGVRHAIDGPLELYDLSTDIGEKKDVASSNPEIVRALEAYLRDCREESPEYPSRPRPRQGG